MRIIAAKTINQYKEMYPEAEESLRIWYEEAKHASWANPNELKNQFANASIVGNKRVVFNIKGNDFRLIVDIEYKLQQIFVIWFGTHKNYSKINVKEVNYVKADKK